MPARSELRQLLTDLVAIDSVNPDLVPGAAGERACARFAGQWLTQRGLEVQYQPVGDDRDNVVAVLPGRGGGGRSLILNAHLDTVGLGDMADPLRPRQADGRLYGRGALDTKAGLAACMTAVVAARREGLRGDVILAGVADEEYGSVGTEALMRSHTADAGLVSEPTGGTIVTKHKGYVWLDIDTYGFAAHGSDYTSGVDAITAMGPVLTALGQHQQQLLSNPTSPTLGPGSLHASLISGGQEMSTYPAHCRLSVERRIVDGETPEQVQQQTEQVLHTANVDATVQVTFTREPLSVSTNEPIVQTVAHQWEQVTGTAADLGSQSGWTDAAIMTAAGVPSTVLGPQGEGLHADEEWVDLASLDTLHDVLRATTLDFCS